MPRPSRATAHHPTKTQLPRPTLPSRASGFVLRRYLAVGARVGKGPLSTHGRRSTLDPRTRQGISHNSFVITASHKAFVTARLGNPASDVAALLTELTAFGT